MSLTPTKPKKNITNTSLSITSTLNWLPKKTFELEITIPNEIVKKVYQKVLETTAQTVVIKGFRKGKAPLNLVETQVGKGALFEKTAQNSITDAYIEVVKKNNLRPILNPQVIPVSMEENKDWVVKAISCEIPEVKLGKYQDAIKGLKAKSAIWTPDKAKTEDKDQKSQKPTMDQILEELLKTCEVEIPNILLEDEVNRLLANAIDQVQAAGLNMEQYLKAKNKTKEQFRQEYKESAEKSLKLEFIIAQISVDAKIEVPDSEIEKLIENTKEPKAKKVLENPKEKAYLKTIVRKQKTIDFLNSL